MRGLMLGVRNSEVNGASCGGFYYYLGIELLWSDFWARLLKNQERPMVLIRCNYVRMLADESETVTRRILLD